MLKNEYLRWFAIQSVNLVTWFAEGSECHGPREARPLRSEPRARHLRALHKEARRAWHPIVPHPQSL